MVWLVLVLIMASVLSYTIGNLLIEYYEYNTVTKAEMKIMTSWPFPSVTVCNLCPFNKNLDVSPTTEALKKVLAESSDLKFTHRNVKWNATDPDIQKVLNTPLNELYQKYSYQLSQFIISAWYNGKRLNITERFEETDTMHGRCFTFNGPKYIKENEVAMTSHDGRRSGLHFYANINQDGYFIYEDITAGVRVYISQHPQTPRIKNDGIDISPGTSTRLALQPITYSFLPKPYKSYGDQYCERLPDLDVNKKLLNGIFYSHERCLDQCMLNNATINCSCSMHRANFTGSRPCTFGEYYHCIEPFVEKFRQFDIASCDCPRPCTFTRYDMTTSSSQMPSKVSAVELRTSLSNVSNMEHFKDNYLNVRVYMGSMLAKSERHEPQYTVGSIVAFLGGQMGFFLGASLITMAELIETLIETGIVLFVNKVIKFGQLRPEPKDNRVQAWVE